MALGVQLSQRVDFLRQDPRLTYPFAVHTGVAPWQSERKSRAPSPQPGLRHVRKQTCSLGWPLGFVQAADIIVGTASKLQQV